jgi:hypothetical protein
MDYEFSFSLADDGRTYGFWNASFYVVLRAEISLLLFTLDTDGWMCLGLYE